MLDIKFIRENPDKVKEGLRKKGVDFDVDELLRTDEERRELIKKVDGLRADHNKISEEIQKLSGKEKELKIAESREFKHQLGNVETNLNFIELDFSDLMLKVPNLPFDEVPQGKDEKDNVVLREAGPKRDFTFKPREYTELGEALDMIDTERAGKVSGSRFGYLKNAGVRLEFALVQMALDFLSDEKNISGIIGERGLAIPAKSFIPVVPPVLVKPDSMKAMGYVERGGEEIYFLEKDNLYLVGTSEQSVGPMHKDETFAEEDLPLRYVSFSTCFRREAGSYGKDTKGILRVHQFDKIEMFVFSLPEHSKDEHALLLGIEEALMRKLGIPHRVLNICAGDLGDPAAAKYDIEAWLPGQNGGAGEYRETHSTSNTTDFQARRLNIRARRKNGALEFLHLLNGTAFAIGRMIIAIMENYQEEDGSVRVPEALRPYMGGIEKILPHK